MSILITGGTGSFGQAFTRQLLGDGCQRICIYSRGEHAQADMRKQFDNDERLRFFIGDVRDRDRLRRAMTGVETVVHAAALKRIETGFYNCDEAVKTNVIGSMNVIDAAQGAGVHKVVFLSSDKAHTPISPYGQTKALAETMFLNANRGADGPIFAVTRYGNVWRSKGSVVPKWEALLESGARKVPISDPNVTRFFMWMNEAVDLVLNTIATMHGGELAIPDLPAYRLGDLAEAMGAEMDIRGLPSYEKMHESMRDGLSSDIVRRMSVEELKKMLA